MNLPETLSNRIATHLEQVGEYLGYLPLTESGSRLLLRLIEIHIHERLAEITDGKPTLKALESVLAALDPPERYVPELKNVPVWKKPLNQPGEKETVKSSAKKILGLVAFLMAMVVIAVMALIIFKYSGEADEEMWQIASGSSFKFAFIDDPAVHGTWVCIGRVNSIEEFQPDAIEKKKDQPLIDNLTFLPGGKTGFPWLKWTSGLVLHTSEHTVSRYFLRKYSDQQYMFLEWLAGGRVNHEGNFLYVLKQPNPTEGAIIEEGRGWDIFTVGAERQALVEQLGKPLQEQQSQPMRWDKFSGIEVITSLDGTCREVRFSKGFAGATMGGIRIGSSLQEIYRVYGTPDREVKKGSVALFEWSERGIRIRTDNDRVTQITVFAPKQ